MPPKPSGPVSRITSDGKCLFRSQSSALGATRSAANASAIVLDGALVLVEFELAGCRFDCGVHGVLPDVFS